MWSVAADGSTAKPASTATTRSHDIAAVSDLSVRETALGLVVYLE